MGSQADPVLVASRLLTAARVAIAADDTNVTDHALADQFIVVVQLDEAKGPWTAPYKLQWRQAGGTFADFGAATEMAYGTVTDLVNGNAVAIGEKACTNTPAGSSWKDGWEVEGTGLASSLVLADEEYTEMHYAIDPANADNSQQYEFRVWDNTVGAEVGICLALITTEAGAAPVTIDCAVGTITLTGNTTSIIPGAVVVTSTAPGTLTLTGNQATITSPEPQTITCTIGTITLTGNQATITSPPPARIISCTIGTLTLTGNASTIVPGGTVVTCSAPGILTLTGNLASISSGGALGEIVDIDHEGGTTGEYDSVVGSPTVNTGSKLIGAYGMECSVLTTQDHYGLADVIVGTDSLRVRCYIDPNTLTMGENDNFNVLHLRVDGSYGALTHLGIIYIRYSSGSYRIGFGAYHDSGAPIGVSITIVEDAPHLVEIVLNRETGDTAADGYAACWIDGAFVGSSSIVENYNVFRTLDAVLFGAVELQDATTSGTIYVDDLIINDTGDEIGDVVTETGVVVDIDHEGGTTGEYDRLESTPTVNTDSALVGSYGLEVDVIDNNREYGEFDFTIESDTLRIRFYINPNTLTMAEGDSFRVLDLALSDTWPTGNSLFQANLSYNSGSYQLGFNPLDDTGSGSGSIKTDITDALHYVEFLVVRETEEDAWDGYATMWVDGSEEDTRPSIDNYHIFRTVESVFFGSDNDSDPGTSGTIYLDDLIINDTGDEIGPADSAPTISCSVGTLTLTGNSASIIGGAVVVSCAVGVVTFTGNQASISSQPPAQTVTCSAPGIITLTGNTSNVLPGAVIISCPAPGQIDLTGNQASILKGAVTVSCPSTGILTLTGNSAVITSPPPGTVTIDCAVGIVTLTGNQADIVPGPITVSCNVGIVTLTGNQASITSPPPAQTINCAVGVVTLTGNSTNIIGGPTSVSCNVGTLNLTGNSATILADGAPQSISCSVGVVTLTGNTADIVPGAVTVSCAVGVVTLTGNQASIYSYEGQVVSCQVASLTFTGNQASIITGPVSVSCSVASLTLQGNTADIVPGAVTISCSVGVITFTGNPASIDSATTVSCAVGQIEFSGQSVTIIPGGTIISCQPGVIQLAGQQADIVPGSVSIACAVGLLTFVGLESIPQIGIPNTKGYVTVGDIALFGIAVGNLKLESASVGNLRVDNVEVDNE